MQSILQDQEEEIREGYKTILKVKEILKRIYWEKDITPEKIVANSLLRS